MNTNINQIIACSSILSLFLLTLLSYANAHGPDETEGLEIELTPSQAIQGDNVPIEAHRTENDTALIGLEVIFTVDKHEIGLSETLKTEEREPGHYFAYYKFTNSGEHEVHIEFAYNGEGIRKTLYINILETKSMASIESLLLVGAMPILAVIWFFGLKGKKKKIKKSIGLSVVVLAILGIGYSLYVTFTTGAAQSGVVVCPSEGTCIWTAHIHTYVPVEICGEEVRLPIEKGSLSGPHTHEEKNVIHWHDRLPYDKVNQQILETTPLTLGAFFDAIEVTFTSDGLADKKNGDVCPDGNAGTLKMFVNGKENLQFRDYVWRNQDVVSLVFDSKTPQEIELRLQQNPIKFPTLGRG